MSASVYIESSVISYLTSRPSRDTVIAGRQAITVAWWQGARSRYEVFVSILVMEEISAGNPEAVARRLSAVAEMSSLGISREAYVLADALLSTKAVCQVPCDYIPKRSYPLFQASEVLHLLVEEAREDNEESKCTGI